MCLKVVELLESIFQSLRLNFKLHVLKVVAVFTTRYLPNFKVKFSMNNIRMKQWRVWFICIIEIRTILRIRNSCKCELLVGSLSVLNEPIKTLWKLQDYRENEQITFFTILLSAEKRENMNKRRKTSLFKSRKWHFPLLNIFFSAGNEKHVLSRGWMENQRFRNREVKSSQICLNSVQTEMMVCIHLGLGVNNDYLLELEVQSWDQPLRNWRSLCTE